MNDPHFNRLLNGKIFKTGKGVKRRFFCQICGEEIAVEEKGWGRIQSIPALLDQHRMIELRRYASKKNILLQKEGSL